MKSRIALKLTAVLVVLGLAAGSAVAYASQNAGAGSGNAASDTQNQAAAPGVTPPAAAPPAAAQAPNGCRGGCGGQMCGGFGLGLPLAKLVSDGVIDQSTADAIQAYLDQRSADMKAEMDKIKAMTPDEAKTYMQSLPKVDIYADMVSKGVLTQAQADAVKAALPSEKGGFGGEFRGGFGGGFKGGFGGWQKGGFGFEAGLPLAKLVSDGVIDQSTADAIQAYLDQRSADMKAEMDKIKAMTPDEAKTYMESLPKVDIFADMVSKGVVTQAQADAVKAALPSEKGGFDGENPARGFTRGANVDDWVANGLIDQSTADAIKAYMASDAFKTAVQQPQDGSSAQPGAGMRRMKIDIISLFVDQKLLTQAQADAINAYMQQKADGFKADAAAPGGARGGGQWFRGSAPRTGGSSSNPSAAGSRAGSLGTGRSM